jgi:hypothetical protein
MTSANHTLDGEAPACFQTEFMNKINEYSKSWRDAALKEQRTGPSSVSGKDK